MSSSRRLHRDPLYLGVALVSLAVLILELALTRLFSATLHYHYAFMAISLALLGPGAAGVAVYLAQERLRGTDLETWGAWAAVRFAISAFVALGVVLLFPPGLQGSAWDAARLVLIYLACALPFFWGGCAITLAVMARSGSIHRLYRYDLAGAAAGCLLLVPLMDLCGGINTILAVPIAAAAGAVLFGRAADAGRPVTGWAVVVTVFATVLFVLNLATGWIDVRESKGTSETDVVFSRWNSFSRVTVARTEGDALAIRIDADASTGITPGAAVVTRHPEVRDRLTALPYTIQRQPNVLIMGPGGGDDVMLARSQQSSAITAVEINPIIAIDIMSSPRFGGLAGFIYQQPGVHLVVDDARSFIRRSDERYDLIQGTMVDTWAATAAGAFALTENHLYTVEAFADYDRHLTRDGVLSLTRWYFDPPDQILRMVSLALEVMRENGVTDPASHLVVAREQMTRDPRTPAILLYKKSRFTDDEVRTLEGFVSSHRYVILYSPLTRPANDFTRLIESPRPQEVWTSYPTNIAPTRDDSPFFFNTVRPSDMLHLADRAPEWRKTNIGTLILFVLLGLAFVLVVAFVVGPLVLTRRRGPAPAGARSVPWLAYFVCLGAGFILVEVALVQRFILFLGPPVYALTVVLFSLLLFCAAGSGLSGRLAPARVRPVLLRVLGALGLGVVLYALLLSPLVHALVYLPRPLRIVVSVAAIAPLAILMGIPMPAGLRLLRETAPTLVPWAWGLNGAASVLGSIAALVIAILAGFDATLLAGAGFYAAGLAAIATIRPSS